MLFAVRVSPFENVSTDSLPLKVFQSALERQPNTEPLAVSHAISSPVSVSPRPPVRLVFAEMSTVVR